MNPSEEHPLNTLVEQASDEERAKIVGNQRALRTLESDTKEAIEERNASTASMLMAQDARARSSPSVQKPRSSGFSKKLFIIIGSVILVAVGIGGAFYLYLQSPLAAKAPAVQKTAAIPYIVVPDGQKTIDMTGLGQSAAKTSVENALSNTGNGNGSILQIVPIQKGSNGTESIMNTSVFFATIGLSAPDILSRSLNGQWMLGTYNDGGTAAPFMILTNNFFQNAYAGMIAWETAMPDSFADIFGYAGKAAEGNVTSTLSSYFTVQGSFKDGVIENKDVRAFQTPDGTTLILYSFVDNNTIVITTDENALTEIINRLEKQTFIR